MASTKLTAIDIFNSLTPQEKRKALAILQTADQSPCQRLGHKYRKSQIVSQGFWKPPVTEFVCERCGNAITR